MRLDGLIELRARELLQDLDRIRGLVVQLAVDGAARLAVALAVLAHRSTSTPMLRAVPAMISDAWSMSRAFRSCSFVSAIWRTCSRERRPILLRFGSADPLSSRSASLISTAAGGVLVMKSNERSS